MDDDRGLVFDRDDIKVIVSPRVTKGTALLTTGVFGRGQRLTVHDEDDGRDVAARPERWRTPAVRSPFMLFRREADA